MEGVDLFEVFRGGEADFRGPGHDPQLFSILTDTLRGICVQPSFDQTDSVRLRFTESGDAFREANKDFIFCCIKRAAAPDGSGAAACLLTILFCPSGAFLCCAALKKLLDADRDAGHDACGGQQHRLIGAETVEGQIGDRRADGVAGRIDLSLIHISEPTRRS